jgi:hypothetical protein
LFAGVAQGVIIRFEEWVTVCYPLQLFFFINEINLVA